MAEYNYTLEGELPEGYPEPIQYAWFPTNLACEECGMPSFEGFLSLHDMTNRYPCIRELDVDYLSDVAEILQVSNVENCTIITGFFIMKEYIVRVPEVHYQDYVVQADSADNARELVCDLQGDESGVSEYQTTLQPNEYQWIVEERPEEDQG